MDSSIQLRIQESKARAKKIIDLEFSLLENQHLTLGREQFGMQKIKNLLVIYFGETLAETFMGNFKVGSFLETKKRLEMKKLCSEYNEKNLDCLEKKQFNIT